jgi:hypothetical protein
MIGEPEQMHVDDDDMRWNGNVRYLSPDEILTGQIKSL